MALAAVIWSATMCHPYSRHCTPSPAMDTFARPFFHKGLRRPWRRQRYVQQARAAQKSAALALQAHA